MKTFLFGLDRPLCDNCLRMYNIWKTRNGCRICNHGFLEQGCCLFCKSGELANEIMKCCYQAEYKQELESLQTDK
jgi:hypothetical protein